MNEISLKFHQSKLHYDLLFLTIIQALKNTILNSDQLNSLINYSWRTTAGGPLVSTVDDHRRALLVGYLDLAVRNT